nr:prephenate dehydratase [Stella humosa]
MTKAAAGRIAFQGQLGAYSHLACRNARPAFEPLPCGDFDDAFAAVADGQASLGMIPIDNSVAGRVADIHHLMPHSGLHIVGEHFQPVHHHLLAPPGATLSSLRQVRSHIHALPQCRAFLRRHGLEAVVAADTAGAARDVAALGDPSIGAIASSLAGEIYGLVSLAANIEDAANNTTRFVILAREPQVPGPRSGGTIITTFVFRVRSVPAALYKALGGFATNGVNMTKLESYMVQGRFEATQFYADVEGHPEERPLRLALEELQFFSRDLRILGVYPADAYRADNLTAEAD